MLRYWRDSGRSWRQRLGKPVLHGGPGLEFPSPSLLLLGPQIVLLPNERHSGTARDLVGRLRPRDVPFNSSHYRNQ